VAVAVAVAVPSVRRSGRAGPPTHVGADENVVRRHQAKAAMLASGFSKSGLTAAGFALAFCAGCGSGGPPTYPVSGTVMFAGKPVPTGAVMFFPNDGGPQTHGVIGADGHYAVEVPAGNHRVAIAAPRGLPVTNVDSSNWEKAFRTVLQPYVPGVYGDPETTPLSFTVVADQENVYDVKIEAPRRRR
jgi:hypothetical protein